MKYYLTILEYGHMGIGKSFERTRILRVQDLNHLLDLAKTLPGVKKKDGLQQLLLAKELTAEEVSVYNRLERWDLIKSQ